MGYGGYNLAEILGVSVAVAVFAAVRVGVCVEVRRRSQYQSNSILLERETVRGLIFF